MNSMLVQLCFYDMRRVIVNKIAVNHRIAVGICVDWISKNQLCMQGRCRSQSDSYSVKVFNDFFVLAYKVVLVAEQKLRLAKLLIKRVASVRLVNNNAVKIPGRRNSFLVLAHNTCNHSLNSRNLNSCLAG